jgi:putative ABC transport system substrate-binding protein
MNRRAFITLAGASVLAAPFAARSQAPEKVWRIGAVSAGAPRSSPHWIAFPQRLDELGYVEGKNISIEFRTSDGRPERLPQLMSDLVRLGVDVILSVGPEASLRAATKATTEIPIVVVAIDYDPIAKGYVRGLARPGGNVTGLFLRQIELTAKRIELLKEVNPKLHRVAVFWDAFSGDQLKEADAAARSAGLQLQEFQFRNPPYSFDVPMRQAVKQKAGGLLGLASPILFRQRADLAEQAIKHRLPAILPFREAAEDGILMAYGASLPDMLRRAAEYIDRIFKGARPADLPMEQPTKFELIVNRKTAKALALTIPQSLLVRADEIIQ